MTAPLTITPPDRAQSYDEWLRWRGCLRKQRLPSEFVARNWLTLLRLCYGDAFDSDLDVYDCHYCDGWHLGHDSAGGDKTLL